MILLLKAESDEGWLGYIRNGYWISVHARTREEARVELLKKLQKLGFPPPAPEAFEAPTPTEAGSGIADESSGSGGNRLEDPDAN
jgi:hypothetical protein